LPKEGRLTNSVHRIAARWRMWKSRTASAGQLAVTESARLILSNLADHASSRLGFARAPMLGIHLLG
jgi:hypothetical protein